MSLVSRRCAASSKSAVPPHRPAVGAAAVLIGSVALELGHIVPTMAACAPSDRDLPQVDSGRPRPCQCLQRDPDAGLFGRWRSRAGLQGAGGHPRRSCSSTPASRNIAPGALRVGDLARERACVMPSAIPIPSHLRAHFGIRDPTRRDFLGHPLHDCPWRLRRGEEIW